MRINGRNQLLLLREKHWEKFINRIYFHRHGFPDSKDNELSY